MGQDSDQGVCLHNSRGLYPHGRGRYLYHCLEFVQCTACATVHSDPVPAQVYFLQISVVFFCAGAVGNTKNKNIISALGEHLMWLKRNNIRKDGG